MINKSLLNNISSRVEMNNDNIICELKLAYIEIVEFQRPIEL